MVFICTHNSRRSQIAQIWARAAAFYDQVPDVETYSGGTEATAFHPNAVKAMKETGMEIRAVKDGDNPVYEIRFAEDAAPVEVFSKVFDGSGNPAT